MELLSLAQKGYVKKSIYSKEYALFCRMLKDERKKKQLTQIQLAKKLKRPQSFIAKVENGERRIDVVEFLSIARTLGMDPVKFIRLLDGEIN